MSKHNSQVIPQTLTEIESEAMFGLLEHLEAKGWSYGTNTRLMCGVFVGPDDAFDLWPSRRTGERELQWSLHYPSTVFEQGKQVEGMHTLLWEYANGNSDEETENNFIEAVLASIAEITALPRL